MEKLFCWAKFKGAHRTLTTITGAQNNNINTKCKTTKSRDSACIQQQMSSNWKQLKRYNSNNSSNNNENIFIHSCMGLYLSPHKSTYLKIFYILKYTHTQRRKKATKHSPAHSLTLTVFVCIGDSLNLLTQQHFQNKSP